MNDNTKSVAMIIAAVLIAVPVGYFGWKADRWLNWKYGYGPKVERQIERVNARIDALEQKVDAQGIDGGWENFDWNGRRYIIKHISTYAADESSK